MNVLKSIASPFVEWTRSLRNIPQQAQSFFYSLNSSFNPNRESVQNIIEYGYISNDNIYSVVSKIAMLVGRSPKALYAKAAQNGRELRLIEKGELYDTLLQPNQFQVSDEFFRDAAIQLLLTGEAFIIEQVESIGFIAKEIIVYPSECLNEIVREKYNDFTSPIKYYDFSVGGVRKIVYPENMMHVKFDDPSLEGKQRGRGLSPLQPLFTTIKASNNRNIAEAEMLANRGASGLLTNTQPNQMLSPESKKLLDEGTRQRIGGGHHYNSVKFVDGDLKFIQLSMSPTDLKILETDIIHLRKICNALGVQSQIFNDPANKSYNNMKEATKALYVDVVIPVAEMIISGLERGIIKRYEERENKEYYYKVEKDKIEALLPDPIEVERQSADSVAKGIMTVNEARKRIGLDPIEGDEYNTPRVQQNNQNNGNNSGQANA